MSSEDTIVAISTPPGRGGIGIVRLSGTAAVSIATPLLRLRQPLAHATARFAEVVEIGADAGARLDEAVVTYFAAPHSYTSEDVIEIAAHGSPVVLEFLLRKALAGGARLARAGEFTERAFLSGRIDLTQAEAVHDLIAAQTMVQARLAAEQMGGALSRRVAPVKELLFSLIAVLEAGIDFAEDDVDVLPAADIAGRIEAIQAGLKPVASSYTAGRLIHDGLTMAIVGRPNVGKSSLFNRLVERDRAIVTAVAGTTRDLVTERVAIEGIPVELIDTAGLRATGDEAEQIGISKTREAMADADVVLAVLDATEPIDLPDERGPEADWPETLRDPRTVIVANKIDLVGGEALLGMERSIGLALGRSSTVFGVSAKTGQGVASLRKAIVGPAQVGGGGAESGMLTSVRHYAAIVACQEGLGAAYRAVGQHIPHEMVLLDLYSALRALDSLTGATTTEDILERIFSSFCIGK